MDSQGENSPYRESPIYPRSRYADIKLDGESTAPLVSDLTHGRIPPSYRAHLGPDLSPGNLARLAGWRPIFGRLAQHKLNSARMEFKWAICFYSSGDLAVPDF